MFCFDRGGAAEAPDTGDGRTACVGAALLALAAPFEAGGGGVPAGDGVLQPGDQFLLACRMLA
jgi:hypothetical protein